MREIPEAPEGSTLARLPKLGALSATAALVLASLVPLTAAADETPAPEESTTIEVADAAAAEAETFEQSKPRMVSEVDPAAIEPVEQAAAEPVGDEPAQDVTPAEPVVEEPVAEDPVVEEPVAAEPAESVEQSTDAAADEAPAADVPAEDAATEDVTGDDASASQEESAAAEESEMLAAQQDDADTDVEIWLTPSWGLSQRDFDENRVSVLGTGFPANTPVTVTLDDQTIATGESLDNGGVNIVLGGFFEPGTYTLTVTVGDVSESLEAEIEPGGYDIALCLGSAACYFDEPGSISTWDMSRVGISYELSGFSPNAPVTLSLGGTVVAEVTPDSTGYATGRIPTELEAGTYTITASSSIGDASYNFVVFDDTEYWGDHDEDPTAELPRKYVSESWLAENPLIVGLDGFPDNSAIEVYLNGEFLEEIAFQWSEEYVLPQDLAIGDYTVEFRHPIATVSVEFAIQPDEQGDPVFAGEWTGNSYQTAAGSLDWSDLDRGDIEPDNHVYPLTFNIDEAGNLTGLSGEFWWVCIGVEGYVGSGYSELSTSEMPTTPLTLDRPFDIQWEGAAFDYRLVGVLNSDGTSSGTLTAHLGACGWSRMEWGTDYTGDIPTPEPTPEPTEEPTPDPTPEPTSEPTVAPTDEPTTEPTQDPTPEPTSTPTDEPTTEPTPTQEPTSEPTSEPTAQPTDEPTPEPTQEPTPDPTAEPTTTPSETAEPEPSESDPGSESPTTGPTTPAETPDEDELDEDNAQGVTAPATARAGDSITVDLEGVPDGAPVDVWLFSDPVHLGSHTVENSAVHVTLPANTTAGDHRIAVYTADGALLGWDTISVQASEPGGTDDGSTDDATGGADSSQSPDKSGTASKDAQDSGKSSGESSKSSAPDSSAGLARTGASIILVALAGIALLAAGAALLMRRRQQG